MKLSNKNTVFIVCSRIGDWQETVSAARGEGLAMFRPGVWRDWRTSWNAISNWRRMWLGVESGSLCMMLTDQQSWNVCKAFYIGETRRSLSDRMNGHRFTTTVSNSDLPVAIHTQSRLIPFQDCWSVSIIHKLRDSTPDHIRCQFEIAYQLVLQSCHTPGLNIR